MAHRRSAKTPSTAPEPRVRAQKASRKQPAPQANAAPPARLPESDQLRPQDVLGVQRRLGNRAALRLIQRGLPAGVEPGAGFEAGDDVERDLTSGGPGASLPDSARKFMEPRMGADLSRAASANGKCSRDQRRLSRKAQ